MDKSDANQNTAQFAKHQNFQEYMPSPFDPPTYGLEQQQSQMVSPFDPPVYGIELGEDLQVHEGDFYECHDDRF